MFKPYDIVHVSHCGLEGWGIVTGAFSHFGSVVNYDVTTQTGDKLMVEAIDVSREENADNIAKAQRFMEDRRWVPPAYPNEGGA